MQNPSFPLVRQPSPLCGLGSAAIAVALIFMLLGFIAPAHADPVFSSNPSSGTLDTLGWKSNATNSTWVIVDYQTDHSNLQHSPGPVLKYPATKNKDVDLLIRKFTSVSNPSNLVLTFDAGWGWGSAGQAADALTVMLLDDNGNGYAFSVHRTKAKWAGTWGIVTSYAMPKSPTWSKVDLDSTEPSVMDGGLNDTGSLQTFTVKRGPNGIWTFSSAGWGGATIDFTDSATSTFSQVALCGTMNFDDIVFGKVQLDVTP